MLGRGREGWGRRRLYISIDQDFVSGLWCDGRGVGRVIRIGILSFWSLGGLICGMFDWNTTGVYVHLFYTLTELSMSLRHSVVLRW